VDQRRQEGRVDGVKVLQREGGGAQRLEAEEVLVEEGVFVLLSVFV
jgi:hypothetical protein